MPEPIMRLAQQIDSAEWIPVTEAHRRSNISMSRLRGYCATKYYAAGQAEKRPGPNGQRLWWVRADAHPKFAAVRTSLPVPVVAAGPGTPKQLQVAAFRLGILTELDARLAENASLSRPREKSVVIATLSRHLADRGSSVSARTIYRWHLAYNASGCQLAALFPRPGQVAEPSDFEEFFAELRASFLLDSKPKKSAAILAATVNARRDGIPIPHEKVSRRYLDKLEAERAALVLAHRGGAQTIKHQILPYIPRDRGLRSVKQDDGSVVTRAMRSDEIWCADHHICDTFVVHDGRLIRPWLTAILDIRSNKIVGRVWSPKAPTKYTVLLALRDAIFRTGGLCDAWYVDNGKDFDAWMFTGQTKRQRQRASGLVRRAIRTREDREQCAGILGRLQIQTIRARPYNPNSKPVERFFGIFEEQFGKFRWTYSGHTTAHKPEGLEDRLADIELVESFEQYVADAEAWIDDVHHHTPLTTRIDKGMSREQVWQANRTSVRTCQSEQLQWLLIPIERAKVGRNGITFRGWQYADPALAHHFGREVKLRVNPMDLRVIHVYTLDDSQKICDAASIDLVPYGARVTQEVADATEARLKAYKRAVKQVIGMGGDARLPTDRVRIMHSVMRDENAKQIESRVVDPPPSIRMLGAPAAADTADNLPAQLPARQPVIDLLSLAEEGF